MEETETNIYGLLADILEYPTSRVVEQAKACQSALETRSRQAHRHLRTFAEFCMKTPLSRLEELYTDTFDIQAICCPYVGYHLFGEDRSRGLFMVKLKEHYRAFNHPVNGELPDHISVMVRSLALQQGEEDVRDLVEHCMIPATKKMVALLNDKVNPYQEVLKSLLITLEREKQTNDHGSAHSEKG